MKTAALGELVERYKSDPESVYNTWFRDSDERMKAFRSIKRGVKDAVDAISAGRFGNDFKGSPLERVLSAITEQKQVFEGAAHPFFWKPKLRIPDIYENDTNKRRFGAFLSTCLTATREDRLLKAMSVLASAEIKGLGPAVASIIYFLHPTMVPPSNTAIVNGFNALFGDAKKLGSWESYLAMRETIVKMNEELRDQLSNDLGAFAGLLFEIGAGRLAVPGNVDSVLKKEAEKAKKVSERRHAEVLEDREKESEHTKIQYLLIKSGKALKLDVHVARNDRTRSFDNELFSMHTIPELPSLDWPKEVRDTIGLIDVIWLKPGTGEIVSAFEIEKSTSIYSGILRLQDLAETIPGCCCNFYLVAPDEREKEVLAELSRPAFQGVLAKHPISYILFHDLCRDCDAICRLGTDHSILKKIARGRVR